jgi:hypothetical protein
LNLNIFEIVGFCGQICFVCKDTTVSIDFIFYKFPLSFEGFYCSFLGKRKIFP